MSFRIINDTKKPDHDKKYKTTRAGTQPDPISEKKKKTTKFYHFEKETNVKRKIKEKQNDLILTGTYSYCIQLLLYYCWYKFVHRPRHQFHFDYSVGCISMACIAVQYPYLDQLSLLKFMLLFSLNSECHVWWHSTKYMRTEKKEEEIKITKFN